MSTKDRIRKLREALSRGREVEVGPSGEVREIASSNQPQAPSDGDVRKPSQPTKLADRTWG